MSDSHKLQHVGGEDWLQRIARFRYRIWQEDGLIDESLFPDGPVIEEVDRQAIQVVHLDEGQLVASIRYAQFDSLQQAPQAEEFARCGIALWGAVALPERLVVHPDYRRRGILDAIATYMVELARQHGARYIISECSPPTAELLRKRGRPSLGFSPQDPRFPGVRYEWFLSDLAQQPESGK